MPTTYLEAIREGIWEEMERDANVFLIGEDIGVYGGAFKMTTGFLERFGERRVVDTPIAESAIVGAAIGASLMGLRPVAEIQFSDFITCGYDQIVNFAAKCRYRWGAGVPIVIRAPSGGGIHGGPFHSQNPEALFTHTPGLKIVAPSSAYDAKGLIKSAIRDADPVLFFEHKALYRRIKEDLPSGDYTVPLGKLLLCGRARICQSSPMGLWFMPRERLRKLWSPKASRSRSSIFARLRRLTRTRFSKSVRKTSKAIVLHEAMLTGGIGGEIAAVSRRRLSIASTAPCCG
jgi:2-oxoisovalerate dehydrogenase E1 component beta subunit